MRPVTEGVAPGDREATWVSDATAATNIEANLEKWDPDATWVSDGDEWVGQARLCGVPYETWKASLVDHLIAPNVDARSEVIEIAPGHGRWSEYLVATSRFVTLVDLSPNCLRHCRERFRGCRNVDYYLTDGVRLPRYGDARIDFIWSYDSFVHMAAPVIEGYLGEFARVLREGGRAIIHHANVPPSEEHAREGSPGGRSAVTAAMVRAFAGAAGLAVRAQLVYWDPERKIGVPRFGDMITILSK